MKKTKLFICLILSVLFLTIWGCSSGSDNNNTMYPYSDGNTLGGGSMASLNGAEWRYDKDESVTALITFSSDRLNASVTEEPYSQHPTSNEYTGFYTYDGETFTTTCDGKTIRLWCSRKVNENTLEGTVWESETFDGEDVCCGYCEFLAGGVFKMHNFLGRGSQKSDDQSDEKGSRYWSYDGHTFKILYRDGSVEYSLQLGDVLYVMSNENE